MFQYGLLFVPQCAHAWRKHAHVACSHLNHNCCMVILLLQHSVQARVSRRLQRLQQCLMEALQRSQGAPFWLGVLRTQAWPATGCRSVSDAQGVSGVSLQQVCEVWLMFALQAWHMRLHHPTWSPVSGRVSLLSFLHSKLSARLKVQQVLHSPEEPATGRTVLIILQLESQQAQQALGNLFAQALGLSLQQQGLAVCSVGLAGAAHP